MQTNNSIVHYHKPTNILYIVNNIPQYKDEYGGEDPLYSFGIGLIEMHHNHYYPDVDSNLFMMHGKNNLLLGGHINHHGDECTYEGHYEPSNTDVSLVISSPGKLTKNIVMIDINKPNPFNVPVQDINESYIGLLKFIIKKENNRLARFGNYTFAELHHDPIDDE